MLQHNNGFFDRGIGRQCKRIGQGFLVLDLVLALSGYVYHRNKPDTLSTNSKLTTDIAAIHDRILPNMVRYSSAISSFLNTQDKDKNIDILQRYFPDELSLYCFTQILEETKQSPEVSPYYYGYLLGLYTELGSPKLDTTRCLLNRLRLDCPHADVSSVCFHGDRVTESIFIAELSHHVQFEKHAGFSIMTLILDIARIYNDPSRWYNKVIYDVDIYRTLYDEPGNIEYEAHVLIESLLRQHLFTMVAQQLSNDTAYLESAKYDIHMHAETIAKLCEGTGGKDSIEGKATWGSWSLEQIYTKYWFVAYLPREHPFRVYLSNELKRFYLKHLYFVCNSEDSRDRYLFMGNIIPLIDFSNFFNLTVMEQQEVANAVKRLASHLQ